MPSFFKSPYFLIDVIINIINNIQLQLTMEKEENKCTSTPCCECEEKKPSKIVTALKYLGLTFAGFAAGVALADPVKKGAKKLFNRGGSSAEQPQHRDNNYNGSYGKK